MKRMLLSILVIAILILSACSSAPSTSQKTYICSNGQEVSDISQCSKTTTTTTGSEDVVESVPVAREEIRTQELSTAAKDLVSKASKANIVSFSYFRSDDPTTQDEYVASRTKMKVTLVNKIVYSPEEQYDTIYLDLVSRTAKAYCEIQSIETCKDRDRATEVNFDDYYVPTPYDWLDMIESADVTGRSKQIDGRTGKEIKFSSGGLSGTMFLDSFFGLPLEVTYEGITYKFQSEKINLDKESELTHQTQ